MGDNLDLRTLQVKGVVSPERLEYCKVGRNSRAMTYEFQVIGRIDEELFKRYIDEKSMKSEKIHNSSIVGMINGLYATSSGIGGIVPSAHQSGEVAGG